MYTCFDFLNFNHKTHLELDFGIKNIEIKKLNRIMEDKTPTKMINNTNQNYSPIILPKSPATPQSKNLTDQPRVARDIAADIYNNIQKWNDSHIQGASTVQRIVLLKCSTKALSEDLEHLIDELKLILLKLSIYSNSLNSLSNQLSGLAKLQKQNIPLFFSLSVQDLTNLVEAIVKAYKSEFMTKQYVFENIGHSRSENEAMFHAACWVHQQYITNKIDLQLEALLTETGHRQIV